MDPNEDPSAASEWENTGLESNDSSESKDRPSTSEDSGSFEDNGQANLAANLNMLKGILTGKHKWSSYLEGNKNFEDITQALKIIYKYNPANTGKNPAFPKAKIGDVEGMRQDIMGLGSIACFLTAQASIFETEAENIEQERKLKRSESWTNIKRDIKTGIITDKMTNDDVKHRAEVDAAELYRMEYEARKLGRMFSRVGSAVGSFTRSLQILVQTSMWERPTRFTKDLLPESHIYSS